jgi:hypothetical protein
MHNNLKKILAVVFSIFLFSSAAQADGFGVGVTLSSNSIDTDGKEDVDSDGTIDATKSVKDRVLAASIFAEYTHVMGGLALTLGVDVMPTDADIEKQTTAQSASGAKAGGASPQTSGNNTVEATIEDHYVVYLQPGYMISDATMLYVSAGWAQADITGKSTSITHTDINKVQTLEGMKLGVGFKTMGDGYFVKVEYSQTDYDKIKFKTDNDTTATADIDNAALTFAIGKEF